MIILVTIIVGQQVFSFLSVYSKSYGLSDVVKDLFFYSATNYEL